MGPSEQSARPPRPTAETRVRTMSRGGRPRNDNHGPGSSSGRPYTLDRVNPVSPFGRSRQGVSGDEPTAQADGLSEASAELGHDQTLAPDTVLAERYVIEAPIGAGGFGVVYRARQLPLGRHVAIKVLPPKALLDRERIARFEHEAALFQRLEHPNTVKLIDFGIASGAPFIVMELLRGESLAALLDREGPQSEARSARVATDVLKALMEAHAVGIVHRDIKPANIFITRPAGDPFFVKLLDFGIAKDTGEDATASTHRANVLSDPHGKPLGAPRAAITGAGQALGTPRYMAPEQVFGEAVGPASDLYSLGLTLVEMLSGAPVFASESIAEILAQQSSMAPTELPPRATESRLRNVIARAIAKAPPERFRSAEEMLAAVEALGIDASRAATSGTISTRIAIDTSTSVSPFEPTTATPLASRRSPPLVAPRRRMATIAIIGGAAVFFASAVVVALFARKAASHGSGSASTSARATESPTPSPSSTETPESLPRTGTIVAGNQDDVVAAVAPIGFHSSKWATTASQNGTVNVSVESADCAGGIILITADDDATFARRTAGYDAVAPRYPFILDAAHHRGLLISLSGMNFAGERCTVAVYHALVQPD